MKTNLILLSAAVFGAAPVLIAAPAKKKTQPDKQQPNLLFIMTDQQRFDALGVAGRFPFLQTPNLDRLANTGAYFTHAYTQCAVSAPAPFYDNAAIAFRFALPKDRRLGESQTI